MRTRLKYHTLVTAVALALLSRTASSEVELASDVVPRIGIEVARTSTTTRLRSIPGLASVLDATPLVTLANDLAAAVAAEHASSAEADRLAALATDGLSAAAREVEAARAQAQADGSRLRNVRAQLTANWGAGVAAASADDLRRIVAGLGSGDTVLVRIDGLAPGITPWGEVSMRCGSSEFATAGRALGLAPAVEPRLRSIGRLELVPSARSALLVPGLRCGATIAGPTDEGVFIAEDAIVRWNGLPWVYVRRSATSFERLPLDVARAVSGGVLTSDARLVGIDLVVAGAGALLAAEFAADVPEED